MTEELTKEERIHRREVRLAREAEKRRKNDEIRTRAVLLLKESTGGSVYTCRVCGKRFSMYDLPKYSLALEHNQLRTRNRGLAVIHARHHVIKGEQPE